MALLQVNIEEELKKAIKKKANKYGVTASSLVKIVLVKAFMEDDQGNVFNADRDNNGKGIEINKFLTML